MKPDRPGGIWVIGRLRVQVVVQHYRGGGAALQRCCCSMPMFSLYVWMKGSGGREQGSYVAWVFHEKGRGKVGVGKGEERREEMGARGCGGPGERGKSRGSRLCGCESEKRVLSFLTFACTICLPPWLPLSCWFLSVMFCGVSPAAAYLLPTLTAWLLSSPLLFTACVSGV